MHRAPSDFLPLSLLLLVACGGAVEPITEREPDSPAAATGGDALAAPEPVGAPPAGILAACAAAKKELTTNRFDSTYHPNGGAALAHLLEGAWYACYATRPTLHEVVGIVLRADGYSTPLVLGEGDALLAGEPATPWSADTLEERPATPGLTFLVGSERHWAVVGIDRTRAVMGQPALGSVEHFYVRVELTPGASP